VYGYRTPNGAINTGICTRTAPNFAGATGDVRVLGPAERPAGDNALVPAGRLPLIGRIAEFAYLFGDPPR
jgi:hypothetical protein